MDTITKEIDGVVFYISQSPGRKVLFIEKQTVDLILPIIGKVIPSGDEKDESKSFMDIDLSGAIYAFKDVLSGLSNKEFEEYIFSMLEYTKAEVVNVKGKTIVELKDRSMFDIVFTGVSTLTLYKLLFEVMKVNRFAFFELVGGLGMDLTDFFAVLKKKTKKFLSDSENSEGSIEK